MQWTFTRASQNRSRRQKLDIMVLSALFGCVGWVDNDSDRRQEKMRTTLADYPKNGNHWMKNVWKERFEKELRTSQFKELVDYPSWTLEKSDYLQGFTAGIAAIIRAFLGDEKKP